MLLQSVFLIIGFCGSFLYAQIEKSARSIDDGSCGTPTTAGVKCVSKTQFVLGYQEVTATPLSCPTGTVCANVPGICSPTEAPECQNDIPGVDGICNACPTTRTSYNPVCVSSTEYAFCVNTKIVPTLKYKCVAPTPYCRATFDNTGQLIGICGPDSTKTDCPAPKALDAAEPSIGEKSHQSAMDDNKQAKEQKTQKLSEVFECVTDGYFANTSDKTCRGYIKCKRDASGVFTKKNLKCSTPNSVFNPESKKCVMAETYVCQL